MLGTNHVALHRLENKWTTLDWVCSSNSATLKRDHEGTTFTVADAEFRGTCQPCLAAVTPVPVTV